jgi:acetyl-CoA synthetase
MTDWIWTPTKDQIEQTNVWRFMQRLGFTDRERFLRYSTEHSEQFWDEIVRETNIEFFHPYAKVLDASRGPEWAQWFTGGTINIAHNCLDRHAQSNKPAIIWESEDGRHRDITFAELYAETNRLAGGLRSMGLQQGDRAALVMPMVPEVVTILYACFKLGVIAVPIFAGFGAAAIRTRLEDSGARVVFTADNLVRRGKQIPLKTKVDESLPPQVERLIVLHYAGQSVPMHSNRDIWWSDFLQSQPDSSTGAFPSETPALLLYTSGTTGKPKGAVHTHAGALAQTAKEIFLAFDHKDTDRFFWLSDIGWMMGPWTIIGNHNFGGTIFLYDGAPDFPTPDRLWETIERNRITTFGVSPTAVRLLMRISNPRHFDLDSLRLLGSTGEPWDETSYLWFFENVGGRRCPIINISGGTEIVGSFLFPLPIQPLKPCTLGGPAPGMATAIVNEAGAPVKPGETGYLVCTKPAPSMTRGIWNDPERYIETYWSRWPGQWNHGDWASVDQDGCWYLHGRADESMNVAGRKVGPAEVEEALITHPAVSEAAVIGVPDELKGETIVAFVVLKTALKGADASELCDHVAQNLGHAFRPKAVHPVRELPKTQSGKVVRRLIRLKYLNQPLGDTSTVENPASLDQFTSS